MVRFRSAVCLVLTASVAAGLCTGCSRSKFTCSGDNLMGFAGYYYRGGDCFEYFSQKYDPLKNEWTEAEYDLVVYGPTEVVE